MYTVEESKSGGFLVKSGNATIATIADRGYAEFLADTYNKAPAWQPRTDRRGPGRNGGRRHYDKVA